MKPSGIDCRMTNLYLFQGTGKECKKMETRQWCLGLRPPNLEFVFSPSAGVLEMPEVHTVAWTTLLLPLLQPHWAPHSSEHTFHPLITLHMPFPGPRTPFPSVIIHLTNCYSASQNPFPCHLLCEVFCNPQAGAAPWDPAVRTACLPAPPACVHQSGQCSQQPLPCSIVCIVFCLKR